MSSTSRDTPRSPGFQHCGGASEDHRNGAVVVVVASSEETPREGVTPGSPEAPMEHVRGHDDAPPVVQRGGGGAPAGSTTASPQLDAPTVDRALRRCLIKLGKRKVVEEASTATAATAVPEPPPKKLMHDGIRAAATAISPQKKIITYVVAVEAPETNKTTATANGASNDDAFNGVPPPQPATDSRFSNLHACSAELRRRLEELDATEPRYVCEKMLKKSDVHLNQNRLLVSCKRDLTTCAITYLFTENERHLVHKKGKAVEKGAAKEGPVEVEVAAEDDNEALKEEGDVEEEVAEHDDDEEVLKEEEAVVVEDKIMEKKDKKKEGVEEEKPGLKVTMFDESGNEYGMMCRYLTSNGGYRFIEEWGKFLKTNGMAISKGQNWTRNVLVKLFAFRSRKLPGAEQSGHPDGALGFVVLHRESKSSGNSSNSSKKEPIKATPSSSSSSAAAAVASSSSAAGVVAPKPKREVSAAARATRSTEEEAVLGMLKLWQGPPSPINKTDD